MRFQVKLGSEVIGFSEFEGGDPPMGVASGKLMPTSAYASIQPYCVEHREHWINISGLTVETPEGVLIECSGGVQIIDCSPELGERGIEIHLNGITSPAYSELFPHHLEAYRNQFR
jgi:hypothetical protein